MRISDNGKAVLVALFTALLSATTLSAMAQEKWKVVQRGFDAQGNAKVVLLDVDNPAINYVKTLKIPCKLRAEEIASMTTDSGEVLEPEKDKEYPVAGARFIRSFERCETLVLPQNFGVLEDLLETSFAAFPSLETFVTTEERVFDDPENAVELEAIDGVLFAKATKSEEEVEVAVNDR